MAKESVYRITSVKFVTRLDIFSMPIMSISETMEGISFEKCSEGIRIYKTGVDGYEVVYAAGIASVRYREAAHV